jgi:hypothetical protein
VEGVSLSNKQDFVGGQFFEGAYALEKEGKLDEAKKLYWQRINEGFDGSFPYERIQIIAAKQRNYEEAITACKRYLSVANTVMQSGIEWKIKRTEELVLKYERMSAAKKMPTTQEIIDRMLSNTSKLAKDRFTSALPNFQSRHQIPEWARELFLVQVNDVPPLKMFYPQYENLDKQQQKFYDNMRQNLMNKRPIDVKGNISYLFLYAYEVIRMMKTHPDGALNQLRVLQHIYRREETFSRYLTMWVFDAFTYNKAYYEAIAYMQTRPSSESLMFTSRILSLKYHLGVPISGAELYGLSKTDSGIVKSNEDVVVNLLEDNVRNFEKTHNVDLLSVITEQFALKTRHNYLFSGALTHDLYSSDLPNYDYSVIGDFQFILKDWMRTAENVVRTQKGLPKIGEGWLHETMLFNIVSDLCKEKGYDVIRHYYPPFLNRQELDIYIPALKRGIEYMGEQHYKPVEIFGGLEGLKKTIERDLRKKTLCEQNGIHVTCIKYDESLDEKYISTRIDV